MGCLELNAFKACIDGDVCERNNCEFKCEAADHCDTFSLKECVSASDGACRVFKGFIPNGDETCLVEEPAYCAPTSYGCDSAIQTLVDPAGTCWMFTSSCSNAPTNWNEVGRSIDDGELNESDSLKIVPMIGCDVVNAGLSG